MAGIDAPEKGQPFGKQAKANLSLLVYGRQVHAECDKQDRYKRRLCKVLVNGVDVNLEQVRRDAWHYKKYEGEQRPRTAPTTRRQKPPPVSTGSVCGTPSNL